jgi:hypothetical protein
MFRILSYGPAAVGLAALVAIAALASGLGIRPAEAAPTGVTVNIQASSIACNGSSPVTAVVTDSVTPVPAALVTFTASSGSIANATTVNGTASTTLYASGAYTGTITVTASVGGYNATDTVSVTCGGGSGGIYDPYCQSAYVNYGCGYNTCYQNPLYYYANCNYGNYGSNLCYGGGCYGGCSGIYGYGGTNTYGCGGANYCAPTIYNTGCNYAPCGNALGSILACTTAFAPPAGSLAALPGRVSILPSATTATCGSATAITVTVTDPHGFYAPDGTVVNFTTTLGYISSTDSTIGGTAVTSLTIPPGTTGNAVVRASSGGHAADTTINVTCAQGAPSVAAIPASPSAALASIPAQIAGAIPAQAISAITQALTGRPAILPPSTGDAGLAALLDE